MLYTSQSSVAPNNTTDVLKADSGASRTYLQEKHKKYVSNLTELA